MPNLVGIGLSQVPTNSMLGGLAYQDPEHASIKDLDLKNLSQINSETADTAVDIFVYDTSKDSDGGAWRKRTQNTSWYNETLGTATRGTRREFPAVAVIVAEDATYTIYDGDDPDLPMWMVFQADGSSGARVARAGTSAITILNGLMCAVRSGSQRAAGFASFISDNTYQIDSNGRYDTIGGWDGIVNRNVTGSWTNVNSSYAVRGNGTMYDVAMTVLPNASIDDATGLPVPTITVGTDAGVSVIMDDGTVVDPGDASRIRKVAFKNTTTLITSIANNTIRAFDNVGELSDSSSPSRQYYTDSSSSGVPAFGGVTLDQPLIGSNDNDVFGVTNKNGATSNTALTVLNESGTTQSRNMVAYIASDYNTGYMHGDIKGAFLSDTDTTNVTSSNLISGATYYSSSRITSYSYTNGSSTLVITDNPATADGYVTLTLGGLTPLTTYVLTVTANQTYTPTAGYNCHIGTTADGTVYFEDNFTGTASQNITFKTASSGSPGLVLYSNYNGALTYTLDLRLAEFDRSVGSISAWNSGQSARIGQIDGLAVYGTITKTPVATGAELVAYSGFLLPSAASLSVTNALIQPYNTSISGTQFVFSGWFKTTPNSDYQYTVQIADTSTNQSVGGLSIYNTGGGSDGLPYMWSATGSSGGESGVFSGLRIDDNAWHHFVAIFDNTNKTLYVDGIFRGSKSISGTITTPFTGAEVYIGMHRQVKTSGDNQYRHYLRGSVALIRIGTSIPSAEQVKKMYNDERHLFQENAKATLYGSSDAVTALAFDDTTNLLHVGTSAGRSDFQGLRRINNTTTAVTTAISASDELIAEQ